MKGAWLPVRVFQWDDDGNSRTEDRRVFVQVGDGYVDFLSNRSEAASPVASIRLTDLLGAIARADR